jgi:GxxExxY protein
MATAFGDVDPSFGEPDSALDELARQVIGAAIEVHRQLGAGLDESLYENAMAKEMLRRQIEFSRQAVFPVFYKGEQIGEKRLDFLVGNRLVLELKAVEDLHKLHYAQVKTYLKISGCELGLLINFNVPILRDGIKRIIYHAR